MTQNNELESWFNRRDLTLDAAGLTTEERREGSIFLGGSAAEFVTPEQSIDYDRIDTVVFNWGDKKAPGLFTSMLEFDDRSTELKNELFPFAAATVVKDDLWLLAVQDAMFRPDPDSNAFHVVPYFESAGSQSIDRFMEKPTPRREQLIGKVGLRWVLFEMSTKIR